MASFPSSLYTYTTSSPNSPRNNPSLSGEVNGANGEIVAIETALGVNLANIAGIAQNAAASVTLGGDLSGTAGTATVAKVHGVSVPAAPLANQIIVASGSVAAQWEYPLAVASVTASVAATAAASVSNAVVLASGTYNVTLPSPSSYLGQHIYVKNTGSGSVTVVPHASEKIDGGSTVGLNSQYGEVELTTDGTNWFIIGQTGSTTSGAPNPTFAASVGDAGGGITIPGTSTNTAFGPTVSLAAAVGDVIQINGLVSATPGASNTPFFLFAESVNASSNIGVQEASLSAQSIVPVLGNFTVASGDLSGGKVAIRLMAQSQTNATTIKNDGGAVPLLQVTNWKH